MIGPASSVTNSRILEIPVITQVPESALNPAQSAVDLDCALSNQLGEKWKNLCTKLVIRVAFSRIDLAQEILNDRAVDFPTSNGENGRDDRKLNSAQIQEKINKIKVAHAQLDALERKRNCKACIILFVSLAIISGFIFLPPAKK